MYRVNADYNVYKNIAEFMYKENIDRHALRKTLGVSNPMISKYLKGENNISLDKAKIIYKIYGAVIHPYNIVAVGGKENERKEDTNRNNKKTEKKGS